VQRFHHRKRRIPDAPHQWVLTAPEAEMIGVAFGEVM
jgi:hypothetical protein